MEHHEIIIVGATMGGTVCAWELIRNGYDVLIIDERLMPEDTLCAGYADERFWKALKLTPEEYPHIILEADLIINFAPLLNYALKIPSLIKKINYGKIYSLYKMDLTNFLLKRANAPYVNLELENRKKIRKIEKVNDLYVIDGTYSCNYLVGAGEPRSCPVRKTFFSFQKKNSLICAVGTDMPSADRKAAMHIFPTFMKGICLAYSITKPRGIMNVGVLAYEKKIKKYRINFSKCLDDFLKLLMHKGMVTRYALGEYYCAQQITFYVRRDSPVKFDRCYLVGEAADPASKDVKERNLGNIESGLLAAYDIMNIDTYDSWKLRRYTSQVFENISKSYRYLGSILFR